ncbi:MAG TPA: DoxX family protein [Solirubrobacteraceae bacterium]|nr:DoxX family protein [Solirubrobacteraceae bacterium]
MSIGRLALRTAIGGLFIGHGTQKLFGWFDGHGLDNTAQMFGSLGLRPERAHAIAAGAAEAGGGAGILLGAFTPLASSAVIATMLTAIRTVHGKNGPWATNQGYEYNLVLIAATLALAETGPGRPSVDCARGRESRGLGTAALALGLGAAGAAGAQVISGMFPGPAPEPTPAAETAAPEPDPVAAVSSPEPGPGAASENGAA